jgi:hypothetical protein
MTRIIITLLCVCLIFTLSYCSANTPQSYIYESNLYHIIENVVDLSSDNTIVYTGESQNWEIIFIVNLFEDGSEDYIKIFRYRGKVNKSLYQVQKDKFPISHKIDLPSAGSTSGKAYLPMDGTFFAGGGSGGNREFFVDTVLKAYVDWSGKKEEIELKNKPYTTFADLKKLMAD